MMIGDGLLTDIKEMIEIAGRKGNTVVTSDDLNSGVSERGSRNSDDDVVNNDGNNENEELSLALIGPPRRRKTLEFMMIEGQPQQQETVAIKMTDKERSRCRQKRFILLLKNRNSDEAKSLEGSTSHTLRDSSVYDDDLVGVDCELGDFV
jgi:hypothetical protein